MIEISNPILPPNDDAEKQMADVLSGNQERDYSDNSGAAIQREAEKQVADVLGDISERGVFDM